MGEASNLSKSNKSTYKETLIKFAVEIRKAVGCDDWQKATERQLKLRDDIHDCVATLADVVRDEDQLLQLSIKKAKLKRQAAQ